MNMEITKYKNNSKAGELNNRLIRLEKILQQLLGITAGIQDSSLNNEKMAGNSEAIPSRLLAQILAGNVKNGKNENINFSSFTIRQSQNQPKSSANNLLLSHGQMIAEIASALSRLSSRNS